jgi:plasmid maintenance system antidote protein VapI
MLLKLAAIQRREGLTDGRMAALLNVPRSTWNRTKNGHVPLTDAMAVRAAGLWPELTRDLLERSASAVSERADSATSEARVA